MISWDCFDTLIARKFIHPFSIFHEVANRINDPSFVQKRIEAGSNMHTYEEIYKKLPYDPQIELDIELEHSYPIKSNIESVNNKDIIITDMYLPDSFIRQLLQKCGLNKDVHLIRTFNGKQTGQVWKNIDSRYIDFHIGDNQHSDYDIPQKYKIKTKLYSESKMTQNESLVYEHDKKLASWMRYTRLQNPYSGLTINNNYSSSKSLLWNDQTNFNLPILALGVKELEKIKDIKLTFNFRDCVYLKPLYDKMTNRNSSIIQTSRIYLKNITDQLAIEQILSAFTQSIVVDLHGSGTSFRLFMQKNNISINDYTLINLISSSDHMSQTVSPNVVNIFTNILETGLNFEKHNFAEIGTIIVNDDGHSKIEPCEHDISIIRIQREAAFCGINSIDRFLPIKANRNLGDLILSKLSANHTSKSISYL
jgi:hypothetical protein